MVKRLEIFMKINFIPGTEYEIKLKKPQRIAVKKRAYLSKKKNRLSHLH